MTLMHCPDCGLVQLRETVNPRELYHYGYGYRSGTTHTMKSHLKDIVDRAGTEVDLCYRSDVVLDIGCNDGTLLSFWPENVVRVGFDPIAKPKDGYRIVQDFFNYGSYRRAVSNQTKVITAIAMFYDLASPISVAKDMYEILDNKGIVIIEVAYIGALLKGAWDGVCHEHLEYYGLAQLKRILERVGFKIFHAELNDINGGSIQVWADKGVRPIKSSVYGILNKEWMFNFKDFKDNALRAASRINHVVKKLKSEGKTIDIYGASTKGNTLLQFCGIKNEIRWAADRNPEKVGKVTPGTRIPIVSEMESRNNPPDYYLVLPWAFKDEFISREKALLNKGVRFIFPLPNLEIVG